jgi:hypothetical protein
MFKIILDYYIRKLNYERFKLFSFSHIFVAQYLLKVEKKREKYIAVHSQ